MEITDILHKTPYKRSFSNGIHSFLRPADAKGSAGVIYCADAYRKFAGQA